MQPNSANGRPKASQGLHGIAAFTSMVFVLGMFSAFLYFLWRVSNGDVQASLPASAAGRAFWSFSNAFYLVTIPFFIIANLSYAVILLFGFINARRRYVDELFGIAKRLAPLKSVKPISILVPCYNEEVTIIDSLQAMLNLDYPDFEIIVVNDGSKDQTMNKLVDAFQLKTINVAPPKTLPSQKINQVWRSLEHANLTVVDKVNGGKADALNAAINFSQYPLICCVDSDSLIDSHGLFSVALPFVEDDETIATGGTILLANGESGIDPITKKYKSPVPLSWFGMIQSVEYIRAFLVGRLGWDYIDCDPIISGAFGLFRKSVVIRVGGYRVGTIGEDMELMLRMQSYCLQQKQRYSVKLLPDPVCWTEPPTDLKTLKNQRIRWSQGLAESLWHHRNLVFRPWAGRLGSVGVPYYFCFELMSAPVEVFGYIVAATGLMLGIFDPMQLGAFLACTVVAGCIMNFCAIVIDQMTFEKYSNISDILKLMCGSILEHFGFRHFHLYWRMVGIVRWLRGQQHWGEMKRAGLQQKGGRKPPPNQRRAA